MFSKTKVKILLVEDEEITANLEKIMLENYGYNVQTVNTGKKAIEVINKNPDIDLILMDIDLGAGIDGTETAKIILQKRDIPVVFLSSHIEPEIVKKTEKITSYGYIVKGSSITVIDASIKMGLKLFNEKIERKQVELELRKERERLEYILSITKTGIDIIDTDFNLLYVDKRWQKIYGEPSARKCYEYFAEFNEPCPGCGIPTALETKSVVINEQRLPRENNRIVEVYTIPFQDFTGQWLVAEFNVDISERKQMVDKLKKSEEKLSSILNNITDVVWSISWPDLKHYYISPSVEKLYGRSNKEFFDNPILFKEVTHPDDQYLTEKAIKQLMKEGKSIRECRIVRPDGSIIWIEDRAKMIYDENIMPIRVEGVTRDITERKQAEEKILKQKEQLEVANAEKEVLLNEIHHRVKNNLQIIQSILNMQKGYTDNEYINVLLDECIDRIHSMALLHQSLYQMDNLAKIDMQQYIQNLSSHLHYTYVKDDCVVRFYNEIGKGYLDIQKAVPLGLLLNEIITNCLKHAFKGRAEGKINISLQQKDDEYELKVKDNGVGLPEKIKISTNINENFKSYGMALISIFTKQLSAEFKIIRNKGTEYFLTFDK